MQLYSIPNYSLTLHHIFFQRYGDPRDLHSFPTRRSSDLRLWGGQYNRKSADILNLQGEIAREISEKLRPKLTGEEDRKSTRLNSSHRTISYAVFCLKKKNHIIMKYNE